MLAYAKKMDDIWFGVACEDERILATNFGDDDKDIIAGLTKSLKLKTRLTAAVPSDFAEKAFLALKAVYDGKRNPEGLSLNMAGLPVYTQRVLRTVMRIPVGYVASYGGVADAAGGGPRAVGNVMATNRFAPLVPCHRVVTSNLGLGGYGGGAGTLKVKFEFLKREKHGYTEPKDIPAENGVLKVFPVEAVLSKLEYCKF